MPVCDVDAGRMHYRLDLILSYQKKDQDRLKTTMSELEEAEENV